MRERRGELPALQESVVEMRDRIATDGAAVGIQERDAVVAAGVGVGPACHRVVGDGHAAGVARDDDDAAGAADRVAVAYVGDGVVIDRGMGAAKIAAARGADLDAVLSRVRGVGTDDGVVVNVRGQRRAVDEDAVLLETADGRILDLDGVRAVATVGDVVAGDEDRVVALDAGDIGAGELVCAGDCDAIDIGVGVEHVDAQEVMVRARDIV